MKTKSWQPLTWPDHNLKQTCFNWLHFITFFTENQGLWPWQTHCSSRNSFDVVEFKLGSHSAFKRLLHRYKNWISACYNYTLTKVKSLWLAPIICTHKSNSKNKITCYVCFKPQFEMYCISKFINLSSTKLYLAFSISSIFSMSTKKVYCQNRFNCEM